MELSQRLGIERNSVVVKRRNQLKMFWTKYENGCMHYEVKTVAARRGSKIMSKDVGDKDLTSEYLQMSVQY